ncbi:hypothetical protein H5R88_08610 [Limosilactobacillus sp. WF-MT5-A]|uniref:hypothetical protein n=1 Tax=Limosilactobacillus agrestis TaxID=2759748 RepID=UPI0015FB84F7|nr:hypothetical protein [Limosilactobacillus agrestis]MBB1100143.1 hypothetical protein [Limosilactobacillus agrestis]MCD7127333.1 hypothetical protein [Limosilactobacillus agrestis]
MELKEVRNADKAIALDWYKNDKDDYTEIGTLVYEAKYKYAKKNAEVPKRLITQISNKIIKYLNENQINKNFDGIIPVPSYDPRLKANKNGNVKIMYLVAEEVASVLKCHYYSKLVEKVTDREAKNSELSQSDFKATQYSGINYILLLDDLYGEGKTANFVTSAIKKVNPGIHIIFISLTRNRFGGLGKKVEGTIDYQKGISVSKNGAQYISLSFIIDNNEKRVNVFSDEQGYGKIQKSYQEGKNSIPIRVKKRNNGYWRVVE